MGEFLKQYIQYIMDSICYEEFLKHTQIFVLRFNSDFIQIGCYGCQIPGKCEKRRLLNTHFEN